MATQPDVRRIALSLPGAREDNGYPAVLIQLSAIRVPELRELITDAWRRMAPRDAVAEFGARPKRRTPKKTAS